MLLYPVLTTLSYHPLSRDILLHDVLPHSHCTVRYPAGPFPPLPSPSHHPPPSLILSQPSLAHGRGLLGWAVLAQAGPEKGWLGTASVWIGWERILHPCTLACADASYARVPCAPVLACPSFQIMPVFLIQPEAKNFGAVGFNLFSNAARKAAMEKARDTGGNALTSRIVLQQEKEGDDNYGVLYITPAYRTLKVQDPIPPALPPFLSHSLALLHRSASARQEGWWVREGGGGVNRAPKIGGGGFGKRAQLTGTVN